MAGGGRKDFKDVLKIRVSISLVAEKEDKLSELWFWTLETQENMILGKTSTKNKVKGKYSGQ